MACGKTYAPHSREKHRLLTHPPHPIIMPPLSRIQKITALHHGLNNLQAALNEFPKGLPSELIDGSDFDDWLDTAQLDLDQWIADLEEAAP